MINKMFIRNKEIIKKEKKGKSTNWILDDGSVLMSKDIYGHKIEIECHDCKRLSTVKCYCGKNGLLRRKYICYQCRLAGKNNPFYGKKHSSEFKNRLSKERKGKWCVGKDNAMYGVNVWEILPAEKIKKMKEKVKIATSGKNNGFYGKTHTEKFKKKQSERVKKWIKNHPEHLKKMIFNSLQSQSKCKKNKIEQAVEQKLIDLGLKFKYSKILHRKYQYDFIINNDILLEVQGDYWHANSLFYGNKKYQKKLNKRQKYKVLIDKKKKVFAEEYGYRIFYIWENEIKNKDFAVLKEIIDVINKV